MNVLSTQNVMYAIANTDNSDCIIVEHDRECLIFMLFVLISYYSLYVNVYMFQLLLYSMLSLGDVVTVILLEYINVTDITNTIGQMNYNCVSPAVINLYVLNNMNDLKPMEIDYNNFDISSVEKNSTIFITGSNSCDDTKRKRSIGMCLLNHMKNQGVSTVILCANKKKFGDKMGNRCEKYDSNSLENIISLQMDKRKKNKKMTTCNEEQIAVLIDSSISHLIKTDKFFREIMFNGKCYGIIQIIVSDSIIQFTPEIRSNMDYIITLPNNDYKYLKRFYEYYAGVYPSFNAFTKSLEQITRDDFCMVISNYKNIRNCRNTIYDKVFCFHEKDIMQKHVDKYGIFDPVKDFAINSANMIVGQRGCGKTTLILNLLEHINSTVQNNQFVIFHKNGSHKDY